MDSKIPDSNPMDAPPAYDNADASSSLAPPEKRPAIPGREPSSSTESSSSTMKPRSVPVETTWKDDMGSLLYWGLGLSTAHHRATLEVHKTVSGLIHDLVWEQTIDSNTAYFGILQSCSQICAAHSLDLSNLLQKADIQEHTPLYWAIVKRQTSDHAEPTNNELPPLIRALLEYSAPLKESTIKDIRLACLHACDQWLFRGLQMRPEFQALPHNDQALLGVQVPPDTINVETPAQHDAPFTVDLEFADFQKRMRISQKMTLDFISHGECHSFPLFQANVSVARMWQLAFYVERSWVTSITLREKSPPTYVSLKYTIEQHGQEGTPAILKLSTWLRGERDPETGKHTHSYSSYRNPYCARTVTLPDAVMYPRSPFLTADGTLRGKVTIQMKDKED
ncbi:hypothetical protein B0H11DRAFT_2246084 [Mycena galericulata]|nr:hypothetical protein B0H11DRAFT_2246084 [Mycena galericulata]